MKRTSILRRTPLRRSRLERRTGIKPMNRARLAARHAKAFGAQAARCRHAFCAACGWGPCDPHHVIPRSRGGLDADTVPLCRVCHSTLHTIGAESFEALWGVDLMAVAAARRKGPPTKLT